MHENIEFYNYFFPQEQIMRLESTGLIAETISRSID